MKFLFLFFLSFPAWSQVFLPVPMLSFDQAPYSISWKKIETPHFEIIFPDNVQNSAQVVAKILESAHPYVIKSLDVNPKKISIILQSKTLDSNGFVTLAPRRSELFLSPSLDPEMTNTDWLTSLSIHEFRHVVQFDKTKQGFNKYFEFFLGEIGVALGLALTTPPWFLEGDAVGIETAITSGGRGRLPLFERDLKALSLNKDFKFDQLLFGSYDVFIPSYYVTGYFFTSFLREKLGDHYSHLINRSASTSYNPLSFYYRADEMVGQKFDDFIKEKMSELITFWKDQRFTPMETTLLSPKIEKGWTNYLFPQRVSESKVFALKQGLGDINQFVTIENGEEKIIFYPAPFIHRHPIKLRNNKFAIVEKQFHPRWGVEDFSTLRVVNLNGETEFTKKDLKWRMAILNHDATQVAGMIWNSEQKQVLSIIDLKTNQDLSINLNTSLLITSLDWLNSETLVFVGRDDHSQKGIYTFDLNSSTLEQVYSAGESNLGFISSDNDRIFVESPQSGIDNIYELKDASLLKITSSEYGSYAPAVSGNQIIFNDYNFRGMEIKKAEYEVIVEEPSLTTDLYERFIQDESTYQLKDISDYPVSSYSKTKSLLNFHSWNLISPILSPTISAEVFSRDLLNENALSVGAFYNYNEGTSGGYISGVFMRYYPVLSYRVAYQGRKTQYNLNDKEHLDRWEEGTAEIGIYLPWKRLVGRFSQTFTLHGFSKLIHVVGKEPVERGDLNQGNLFSPGINISFSSLSRLANRDLMSPLGFSFFGHYEAGKDISGSDLRGDQLSLDTRIYLPGLFKHHSFFHQFAYENQNARTYEYASLIQFPRGLAQYFLDDFFKYSANYMLPLFYPDENLGRFLYLKRVSTNLFYDDLNGNIMGYNYEARSTGAELLFETYLLRLSTPVVLGLRYSHVLDGLEKSNFGFFINTNLSEF